MNIQFKPNGTKEIQKIYIRVYANRLDLSVCTELSVLKSDWDAEKESSKTDLQLNENLLKLKLEVLKQFNYNLTKGLIINTIWLKNVVKTTFDRPIQEVGLVNSDFNIYVSDFAYHWLDNFASSWKVSQKKYMSSVLKSQYRKFVDVLSKFEESEKTKFNLKDLTIDDIYSFVNWLQEQEYNTSTVNRMVARLKFFLNRSSERKINVSAVRNQRVYIDKEEEFDGVFLSEEEINRIINYDFSFSEELSVTKDNFIIGIYSGLRSSDFLTNLDVSNFKDGYLKIKTQKTKTKVVLPVHNRVQNVLNKHFGMLPPKQTNSDFNKHIKTLCMICDIDNKMEGKLFDKEKKRKVFGNYPKFKMITAHSLRRSFCSNMRGKISDENLRNILGWSTTKLISLYDKTSNTEHADKLRDVWENK